MYKSLRKLITTSGLSIIEKKFISLAFDVYKNWRTNANVPPLIIMHCQLGTRKDWKTLSETMMRKLKRKIYVLDARNHGDSHHHATHDSEAMATDILEFIQAEGILKAALLGHGMGGRAMMCTALKSPSVVERIMVLDTTAVSRSQMAQVLLVMRTIEIPKTTSLRAGKKMVSETLHKIIDKKEIVNFILNNLRKKSNGDFYWIVNVDALINSNRVMDVGLPEKATQYEGPTLFVRVNDANFITIDNWTDIQRWFPNAEIHLLNYESTMKFNNPKNKLDLILNFFKS